MSALLLSNIRMDGGTQPRATIDTDLVGQYAEAMVLGANFPPPIVFYDGADYWLADGFHRYHAHVGCQHVEIECDVRQGTQRDAVLFSVGANADHGWRRTREDKNRAVRRLLDDQEWSQWSDNDIRKTCKVSLDMVQRLRRDVTYRSVSENAPSPKSPVVPDKARARFAEIEDNGGIPRYFKNKHGVVSAMDTSRIGSRPAPDRPIFDSTPVGERAASERWTPNDIAPSASKPDAFTERWNRDRANSYISFNLQEVEKFVTQLPQPEMAAALFPSDHRHTFTHDRLVHLADWFARFASAWRDQEGARNVAAE